MLKKYLDAKKISLIALAAIMLFSFFVRSYNFHDWLYFKMDQARDANLVGNAINNGPEYLPLLGPRAGATQVSSGFLRLGPAFYYFQYIGGKLFNSTKPDVFAYPDLFFSILTIPLLYAFLCFYFSRFNSVLITAMYSFSFIVIQYSRFAWNPNSLLFFTLLSFYSLLKFIDCRDKKKKIFWITLWALGAAIGSQLHFIGLFCLLGVSFALLFLHLEIWKKSHISKIKSFRSWRNALPYCLTFLAVFMLIYSPVIISDIMKNGRNSKNFIEALSTKSNDKPLSYKIKRSIAKQGQNYCLITTSDCYTGKVGLTWKKKQTINWLPAFNLTLFIMLSGLTLTAYQLAKRRFGESDKIKKYFLWLILLWFGSLFILAIPLYASLRPRFFIFIFPIPFIFIGLVFEFLEKIFSKKALFFSFLATCGIITMNMRGTIAWFSEQKESQIKNIDASRTLILKNQDGVTLGQLERATDYIYSKKIKNKPLYFSAKTEHVMPIKYLLYQKNDSSLIFSKFKKIDDPQGLYFTIIPSHDGEKEIREKFGNDFSIISHKPFGQISVYEILYTGALQEKEPSTVSGSDQILEDRLFWKDVFGAGKNSNNTTSVETDDEIDNENSDETDDE